MTHSKEVPAAAGTSFESPRRQDNPAVLLLAHSFATGQRGSNIVRTVHAVHIIQSGPDDRGHGPDRLAVACSATCELSE